MKTLIEKRQRAIDQQKVSLALDFLDGGATESPFPTPVMKPARPHLSAQEKQATKTRLLNKFPNLPERFVEWALDAAMYEVEKSERLLREVGPQTPDEFKPFVVASKGDGLQNQQQQRRSKPFLCIAIFCRKYKNETWYKLLCNSYMKNISKLKVGVNACLC